MSKLYFKYGTVNSSKSLNLLAIYHNYNHDFNKKAIIIKPEIDTRFGIDNVTSKAGLTQKADYVVNDKTNIFDLIESLDRKPNCIFGEEIQFFTSKQIDELRLITYTFQIPIICFGLRSDFRTKLFPASQRLLEVCDVIEEVKSNCYYCNKKGILNLKHHDGKADIEGNNIELGCEDLYRSVCFGCYNKETNLFIK
jgi:thymidine kinase